MNFTAGNPVKSFRKIGELLAISNDDKVSVFYPEDKVVSMSAQPIGTAIHNVTGTPAVVLLGNPASYWKPLPFNEAVATIKEHSLKNTHVFIIKGTK